MAVASRRTAWVLALGLALAAAALVALRGSGPQAASAASHREAPLISLDPPADITDVYFFRSYETGRAGYVDLIMDVIPGEEPSSGPNYWNFDPNVAYTLNVDNDADGRAEDVQFEFRFHNEFRGVSKQLGLFLPYVALPPITKLDGAGSEGLGFRQTYDVVMKSGGGIVSKTIASGLIAAPSNVGPRTMPNYDNLASQAIYPLDGGGKVFAGQRDDPFAIDLGAIFDTLNLRAPGTDMLSGFNVHTIALEVPETWLTSDHKAGDKTHHPKLGLYGSTSRRAVTVDRGSSNDLVQVQRLGNPLVNEAIIGTIDKDRWNATEPEDEAQFLDYYTTPRLAIALNVVFGAPIPATPRTDLRDLFLTYGNPGDRLSELLRLDLSVPPVPLANQKPLTVLAGDNAGWPNGRRPIDDVTDIAIKVVGGPSYASASDGVSLNDKALPAVFPFIPSPWDGRNRVHQNP